MISRCSLLSRRRTALRTLSLGIALPCRIAALCRALCLLPVAVLGIPILRIALLPIAVLRIPVLRISLLSVAILRIPILRIALLPIAVLRIPILRIPVSGITLLSVTVSLTAHLLCVQLPGIVLVCGAVRCSGTEKHGLFITTGLFQVYYYTVILIIDGLIFIILCRMIRYR